MANSCIFCDGTILTKEHIFPQWLIKELDIEKEKISLKREVNKYLNK